MMPRPWPAAAFSMRRADYARCGSVDIVPSATELNVGRQSKPRDDLEHLHRLLPLPARVVRADEGAVPDDVGRHPAACICLNASSAACHCSPLSYALMRELYATADAPLSCEEGTGASVADVMVLPGVLF
jgi:hypothetical protein